MCLAGLTCASPCQSLRSSACIRSTLMSCTEACRDPARMRRRSESGPGLMAGLMGAASMYVEGEAAPVDRLRPSLSLLPCRMGGMSPVGRAGERQPLGVSLQAGAARTMGDGESRSLQHAVSLQPTALTSLCRALEASVLPAISKASLARCCCQSPAQIWEQPLVGSPS